MPALHERSIEETLPLLPLVTPRSLVVRNAFTIFTKFFENGHRRVAAIYTWKRRQRRVADACQLRVIRPPPRFFPGWGRNWCCRAPRFITRKGGGGRGERKSEGCTRVTRGGQETHCSAVFAIGWRIGRVISSRTPPPPPPPPWMMMEGSDERDGWLSRIILRFRSSRSID